MTRPELASPLIGDHPPLTAGVERLRAYRRNPSVREGCGGRFHGVSDLSFDGEAAERALEEEEFATALGNAPNVQNTELTSLFAAAEHRVI